MPEAPTQAVEYCSDLMQRQDEDRWLAARYAPDTLQTLLTALGAFILELHRIPGAISEPALGEIRLQWWREALDEIRIGKPPRAHPVVEAVAVTGLHRPEHAERLDGMIDAMTRMLYGETFTSAEELFGWFVQSDGAADAVAVIAAGGDEGLAQAASKAGAAFAMVREGAAVAPALAASIPDHALRIYREAAPTLKSAPSSAVPAMLHLSLTPIYVRLAGKSFPVRKRLRLFSAMAFSKF